MRVSCRTPTTCSAPLDLENHKYDTAYGAEMIDTEHNTWFELRPLWAFAVDENDFTGSPTRWSFAQERA